MAIRITRDYHTLTEIRERWKLQPESFDLHRAILAGLLRLSFFVNADLVPVRVEGAGYVVAGEAESVHGLCFAQGMQQTGVFDCSVSMVSRSRDLQEGDTFYLLETPMTMAELLDQCVVMAEDLAIAEEIATPDDLSTKEQHTMLRLLAIALVDGYGVVPGERSAASAEIAGAGERLGLPISENSVRKMARRAFEQFPPQQMDDAAAHLS